MYCPNCGAESTQGLNYCKRCGGSLNAPATSAPQEARPAASPGTAWAVGLTMMLLVVIGLGILFGAMSELVHFLPAVACVFIMLCGSLTVLGSVFMLTRFWMRLLTGTTKPDAASLAPARRSATGELGPARVSALPDAPFSSVTEHTTRTLEHVAKVRSQNDER
jgi:hypothetical protein